MTWTERNNSWLAAPYRIYRSIRGMEAWVYGAQSFCLGREISTLDKAKSLCSAHQKKGKET